MYLSFYIEFIFILFEYTKLNYPTVIFKCIYIHIYIYITVYKKE